MKNTNVNNNSRKESSTESRATIPGEVTIPVTIHSSFLSVIDEKCKELGFSRSEFFEFAALKQVADKIEIIEEPQPEPEMDDESDESDWPNELIGEINFEAIKDIARRTPDYFGRGEIMAVLDYTISTHCCETGDDPLEAFGMITQQFIDHKVIPCPFIQDVLAEMQTMIETTKIIIEENEA